MNNTKNYISTILNFFGKHPLEYCKLQQKFMADINKTAKKYGYKEEMFAENDKEERMIKFIKIKNE
jgi:hypothetical protein